MTDWNQCRINATWMLTNAVNDADGLRVWQDRPSTTQADVVNVFDFVINMETGHTTSPYLRAA